jgi:aryl-alcohol dehydrogenase-like predicted oxidoreductase
MTNTAHLTIPATTLDVYPLCLGGNVFGWSADESQSQAVLNAFSDLGGNFIDTADVYSEWVDGNVGGESEAIIGNWMKARGNRHQLVIATKVAKLSTRSGLRPENIIAACNDSLKRLQTDHIDLYYSHHDDKDVPIAETLGAYQQLINEGKIRYIGASQHTGARLQEALDIATKENLPKYVCLQDQYNLMERNPFESEQQEVLKRNNLSALPFYGLARGFLTGKYRPGVSVDSIRAGGITDYQTDKGYAIIDSLDKISKSHNSSISAVALAWLRANPQVSTPIASARTVEQLREIMQIVELTSDEVAELKAISI